MDPTPKMTYRVLGATKQMVSSLGFGASPLGGVFGAIDEREAIRSVHLALDLGVTYFDVAPYYGSTRAEAVLGQALAGVPRDRYVLATKVGRYGAEAFDWSAARTRASVAESLERLGVDHVDLLQCHDIEFAPPGAVVRETLPELERLRRDGVCRAIGISGLPLSVFPEVIESSSTTINTVLSYCHGWLADTTLDAFTPYCAARGIAVINASPLGMGLFGGTVPAWHPAPADLRDACARAVDLCRARGADPAQLAVRYAHDRPGISTTLVGMSTTSEVHRNVAAIAQRDDDLLSEVQAILAPVQGRSWPSGRPSTASGAA